MTLTSRIRASFTLTLLACTAAAAAQTARPQAIAEWVSWGMSAGAQHAADLARRGLENTYVACGIRASLELASKVQQVTADQRYAFFTAFEDSCTRAKTGAHVASQADR